MKSAFKHLLATAAFIAANTASAASPDWHFESGSGSLVFSQEALDALDASGAFIMTDGVAGNKATYDGVDKVSLAFTGGTAVGSKAKTLASAGSTVFIERVVVRKNYVTLDRLITLSNFEFDLGTKTLSAGVKGTNLLTNVTTDYGFRAIYSASQLVGGTIGEPFVVLPSGYVGGTASGHTEGMLSIDNGTADLFLNVLGLPPTGSVADLVKNANWGTASATGVFSTVPEPASYMSFLAGLAVLGAMGVRKRSA